MTLSVGFAFWAVACLVNLLIAKKVFHGLIIKLNRGGSDEWFLVAQTQVIHFYLPDDFHEVVAGLWWCEVILDQIHYNFVVSGLSYDSFGKNARLMYHLPNLFKAVQAIRLSFIMELVDEEEHAVGWVEVFYSLNL